MKGFAGYSSDCLAENPLCWPFPTNRRLFDRIAQAEDFWRSWEDGKAWPQIRDSIVDAYESQIGVHSNYYAIDGGNWPPKALLRIPILEDIVLVTAGMCIRPQPNVEMYTDDPGPYRRIELGMRLGPGCSDTLQQAAMRYLSGQTGYPWHAYSWLGHGHTFPCDVIPPGPDGTLFPFVLLQRELRAEGCVLLPAYRGDRVSLLWMIPITKAERDFAESHGSEQLAEAMVREGVGIVYRGRPQVKLDAVT